jgi:NADPH:quinone reductase-like Zn-dependent oxidoreductase
MRTYRLNDFGNIDGLVPIESEKPVPGPGEVLIRVHASSINFRDLAILLGLFPMSIPPGRIPLSDAAGEIEEIGEGVTRFKEGDRVVNSFFPIWFGGSVNAITTQYVADVDGWLSEYKVVNAEALVRLPDYLSFEEGATLPCAAVTAWSALADTGAGDTVLTQGTGGVSLFALQLAKARGARVIATTSSTQKAERLRDLGADHVIDYRVNNDWGEKARAMAGGRGVDRIVETGGPDTLPQSIKAVAIGGQISLVGVLAGIAGGIDFMSMFMSMARFQPIVVGSRRDLEDMIRVMEQHEIKPVIDSSYAMDDAKEAWNHFAGRQLFGKVVIRH